MAINTRTTKTGRIVIEMDGCSDYYGGALVQGGIVCKVSFPKTVTLHKTAEGETYLRHDGFNYWEPELVRLAAAGQVKGARVYEFHIVQ